MTRKDYELIADTIRECVRPLLSVDGYDNMVREFGKALVGTNPNFKREKFAKRCMGE